MLTDIQRLFSMVNSAAKEILVRQVTLEGTVDPTAGSGVAARLGAMYVRKSGSTVIGRYEKIGTANTAWQSMAGGGGGGGSGPAVVGDWDCTPVPAVTVNATSTNLGTWNSSTNTLTSDFTSLSPGGLGVAVVATDLEIGLAAESGKHFGLQMTQTPSPGTVQLWLVGFAPAGDTAADIAAKITGFFMSSMPAAPFGMMYIGATGSADDSGAMGVFATDSSPGGALFASGWGAGAGGLTPGGAVANDHIMMLLDKHDVSGDVKVALGCGYVRASDGAYDIGTVNWVAGNPVVPANCRIFYALACQDIGSGYASMSTKASFTQKPNLSDVTDTTFDLGSDQAAFDLRYPVGVASLMSYSQATFSGSMAVNELYRVQVGSAPVPAAPYGTTVYDESIVVIDNIDSGTEAFRILTDGELIDLLMSENTALLQSQIATAQLRAGEMVFLIADTAYTGPVPLSGGSVYATHDLAYAAAITYPAWVPKRFVYDDRQHTLNVDPMAEAGTYGLLANNIRVSTMTRWMSGLRSMGGYGVRFRGPVDGLCLEAANVLIDAASSGAIPTLTLSSAPSSAMAGTDMLSLYALHNVRVSIESTSSLALAMSGAGPIEMGDDCEFYGTVNVPAYEALSLTMGDNAACTVDVVLADSTASASLTVGQETSNTIDFDHGFGSDLAGTVSVTRTPIHGLTSFIVDNSIAVERCVFIQQSAALWYNTPPGAKTYDTVALGAQTAFDNALAYAASLRSNIGPVYVVLNGAQFGSSGSPIDLQAKDLTGLIVVGYKPEDASAPQTTLYASCSTTTWAAANNAVFQNINLVAKGSNDIFGITGGYTAIAENCNFSCSQSGGYVFVGASATATLKLRGETKVTLTSGGFLYGGINTRNSGVLQLQGTVDGTYYFHNKASAPTASYQGNAYLPPEVISGSVTMIRDMLGYDTVKAKYIGGTSAELESTLLRGMRFYIASGTVDLNDYVTAGVEWNMSAASGEWHNVTTATLPDSPGSGKSSGAGAKFDFIVPTIVVVPGGKAVTVGAGASNAFVTSGGATSVTFYGCQRVTFFGSYNNTTGEIVWTYEVESYDSASWTAPTLLNSWVNVGGDEQPAQYRRYGNTVEVRGAVKDGTSAVMFNLPADYRPSKNQAGMVIVHDNTDAPDFGHVKVLTGGDVTLEHPGSLSNHKAFFNFTFSVS